MFSSRQPYSQAVLSFDLSDDKIQLRETLQQLRGLYSPCMAAAVSSSAMKSSASATAAMSTSPPSSVGSWTSDGAGKAEHDVFLRVRRFLSALG